MRDVDENITFLYDCVRMIFTVCRKKKMQMIQPIHWISSLLKHPLYITTRRVLAVAATNEINIQTGRVAGVNM